MFPFSLQETWVAKINSYICELDAYFNSNELFFYLKWLYVSIGMFFDNIFF